MLKKLSDVTRILIQEVNANCCKHMDINQTNFQDQIVAKSVLDLQHQLEDQHLWCDFGSFALFLSHKETLRYKCFQWKKKTIPQLREHHPLHKSPKGELKKHGAKITFPSTQILITLENFSRQRDSYGSMAKTVFFKHITSLFIVNTQFQRIVLHLHVVTCKFFKLTISYFCIYKWEPRSVSILMSCRHISKSDILLTNMDFTSNFTNRVTWFK